MEILQHKQAGDVLLIAKQGYYIGQDDGGTTEKTSVDLGNHGGDPERSALRPILYMTGSPYSETKMTEEISIIDIAPTLYELMDLKAPQFMDGKVISEIVEAERGK